MMFAKQTVRNIDSICLKHPNPTNPTNPNPNPNLNPNPTKTRFSSIFLYISINIAISRCLQKKLGPNIDSICLKRPNPTNPNPNPNHNLNPNPTETRFSSAASRFGHRAAALRSSRVPRARYATRQPAAQHHESAKPPDSSRAVPPFRQDCPRT